MTAVWLLARAELRARWRLWVVLGLLAGATAGLAVAGIAGARRTAAAVPRALDADGFGQVDAAILPNDPRFDEQARAAVADLPEVEAAYPFVVPFALRSADPKGMETSLIPTTPEAQVAMTGTIVEGRAPDPDAPDEIAVNETNAAQFGLDIGSTIVWQQKVQPQLVRELGLEGASDFEQPMRVVGIIKAYDENVDSTPSAGFYAKYGDQIAGPVNMFVRLEGGESQFVQFQKDVRGVLDRPVNVERASDLIGLPQVYDVVDIEERGLQLFALAVVIGGGVLVGQALVRAVSAGAADHETWRAFGVGRRMAVGALVAPAALTAFAAVPAMLGLAVVLSPRFPIGVARIYELDIGLHADWLVIAVGALTLVLTVFVISWLAAEWRVTHDELRAERAPAPADWAARAGLPPSLTVGSRLAIEPGRGRRAVPVRSALVGAIAGVLGVVACFTFRAGITDAVENPERSGIVWDYGLISFAGFIDPKTVDSVAEEPDIEGALDAVWARAIDVNGTPTPTFGTESIKGPLDFVVLSGRAPQGPDEIAFAPATMRGLGLRIGDEVTIGEGGERIATVVGEGLVPATSHTAYDQSGWMTLDGLRAALPPPSERGAEDIWDYVLIRWRPDTDVAAAEERMQGLAGDTVFAGPPELPASVVELGHLRSLPLVLGIFFALLAIATVAHALVTTVRRRRSDLAILRALGFTPTQSRLTIAWQATLLAIAGLVLGVPLGIITGRLVWHTLADGYPLVYVPPLSVVALLLVVPAALLLANVLAAGPARAAARIRPAETLRTE